MELDSGTAHRVFDQPDDPDVDELVGLFTVALNDLGRLVGDRHGGRFTALVGAADASVAGLVEELAEMAFFRDVSAYDDLDVPLFKRAQLAAADLHRAFGGAGPGRFDDLDRLTAFADNLVPHVLRLDGVLRFEDELADRIEAGEQLAAGSPEEVEIRAVGVHAVEELRRELADQGRDVPVLAARPGPVGPWRRRPLQGRAPPPRPFRLLLTRAPARAPVPARLRARGRSRSGRSTRQLQPGGAHVHEAVTGSPTSSGWSDWQRATAPSRAICT